MRWPWSKADDVIYEAVRGLAESHCPSDVIEFGQRHKIENFAVATWQNGYRAGWRAAMEHMQKSAGVSSQGATDEEGHAGSSKAKVLGGKVP